MNVTDSYNDIGKPSRYHIDKFHIFGLILYTNSTLYLLDATIECYIVYSFYMNLN